MRSAQSTAYLERLDHLRFYAAALVVMFHFFHTHVGDIRANNPLLSLIDEGHTGIGLFMVISGFIFTMITRDGNIAYWPFIRNRLIRIYPLFIFAVFLSLFISTYNEHMNYGFDALLGWVIPFRSDTVPLAKYFIQLWTIWVEFQFYLLFPFLKVFADRYGTRYLLALIGLLILIRLILFAITGSVRFLAYETIFGRLDEFLIGMIVARIHIQRPALGQHPLWLLGSAILVLSLIQGFSRIAGFTDLNHPVWIVWTTCEGAMWALFLLAYLNCRWQFPALPDKLLARLGTISFSIYVMHNYVIAAIGKTIGSIAFTGNIIVDAVSTSLILALPAVILLACVTYLLIERPFLSFRRSYVTAYAHEPKISSEPESVPQVVESAPQTKDVPQNLDKYAHLIHRLPSYELLHGAGLEIGALTHPSQIPKCLTVQYADANSREDAKKFFPETDHASLVEVDFVLNLDVNGLTRFEPRSFDFVIMSHVIEHLANPIAAISELFRVCTYGGHVVIAAPDKDYSFDRLRAITSFEHLLDEYQRGVTTVTDEHYLDFMRNVHPEHFDLPPEQFERELIRVRNRREHAHVWDSAAFATFMRQTLALLDIDAIPEVEMFGQETGHEYFAVWRKLPPKPASPQS